MLNDDILIAQSSLWANLKLEGKSVKYNQLVNPTLTSSSSSVPSANQFGSFIQILDPIVGHKVYAKITTSNPKIRVGWYISGSSGYDFVDGSSLSTSSSVSNVFEGVYEITSSMVHTGTGYLQLYYWLYSGLPTGSHTITIQLVDLTALGMDTIINPVLFNATDLGKVMSKKTLSNGSGILSFKAPYKCYKDIPMKSVLGKQNTQSNLTQSGTNKYIYMNENGSFGNDTSLTQKLLSFKANHKYFVCLKGSNLPNVLYESRFYFRTQTDYFTTHSMFLATNGTIDSAVVSYTNDITNTFAFFMLNITGTTSQDNFVVNSAIVIDLTELGLDTLTAQQFYDRYNQYFDKLANGETNSIAEINMWKRVDLGSLTWYQASNGYFTTTIPDMKLGDINSPLNEAFCPKYQVYSNLNRGDYADKGINYGYTGGGFSIRAKDTSISTDNPTTFKNGMNGVYLYYETATPTELYGMKKASSLLGKQNVSATSNDKKFFVPNGNTFIPSEYSIYDNNDKSIQVISGHKYFCYFSLKEISSQQFRFYIFDKEHNTYVNVFGYGSNKKEFYDIYTSNFNSIKANFVPNIDDNVGINNTIEKEIIIDLTALGLDNLTAQQFYDQYKDKFEKLTNGQSTYLLCNTYENINGRSNVVLGAVDLGTLSWEYAGANLFYVSLSGVKTTSDDELANIICGKYETSTRNDIGDKNVCISNTDIIIKDTAYTNATTFKNSLNGVILIYELATPRTDYYLSRMIPKNVVKIIDDNGMEIEV